MPRSPLSLLAFLPFLSSCSRSDSSTTPAGYNPPSLAGWDKDEAGTNNDDGHSITYRKKVGEAKIRMKFSLLAPVGDEKPDDLAALKRHTEEGLVEAHKISLSLKVLEQKDTTFRNFPAVLTRTHDEYRRNERERKILRVADGKNTFWIDQTLTAPKIDAAARREADVAWETFTKDLKIEVPSGT